MLSSVLALTAVAAATTAVAEPVSSFRCEKRAFYPTAGAYAGKPGGTRHVMIPQSMCADVADGGEIMQALCCANTHVNCSSAFTEPTLVSYDGSHYPLKNEQHKTSTAETVLADADRRLCSMMMADKCSDCDRSKCSLFSKSPVPKKCYSRTYTDKPDGSGWIKNATASASATAECPPIATQGQFNLTEWIRASWFIQEQQINGFQEPEDLFCVVATYKDEGRTVPLWEGTVVSVYNYQNRGAVNGPGSDPEAEPLCARLIDPEEPSNSIINAPCFLPNALSGPYWVVAAGPSPERYTWGIVSGGPPTIPTSDGCHTSEEGVNGAGFWIFTRARTVTEEDLADIRTVARMNGFSTSLLRKVQHVDPATGEACLYTGARILPDEP